MRARVRIRHLPILSAILLALALLAAPAGAEIERKPAFQKAVGRAIDKGVEWVFDEQERDGGWLGYAGYPCGTTALAYHTLRVCGVPRDDTRMQRAYTALRAEYVKAKKDDMLRTYAVALTMMAIEEHGRGWTGKKGAKRRYGNQSEDGTFLEKPDLEWMRELVAFLEKKQNQNGTWRYGNERQSNNNYDHSNTQYALLGLKAASRSGVKVKTQTYTRVLKHLLDAQEKDGPKVRRHRESGRGKTQSTTYDHARGWSYFSLAGVSGGTSDRRNRRRARRGSPAYGSMTAGSVGAVVICRSELLGRHGYGPMLDQRARKSLRDGIAWLGHNFAVSRNPNHGGWLHYYLYAVERAGVLAGVDWMADHDWYGEGAEHLIDTQRPNGTWVEAGSPLVTTCFGLLFLKRGTIRVVRGALTSSSSADSVNFKVAPKLSDRDFSDFIDLVLSKWDRAGTDSETRGELERRTTAVGPRIVLPLIQRLASEREGRRAAAYAVLDHATGEHLPFEADADLARRSDQIARWEEWYLLVAGRLVYDAGTGRLVAK